MVADFKLNNLMKQAQEMQKKMQAAQKEIEETECSGEAGAGLVKITLNGRHKVNRIKIDPALLKEEIQVIEDLVTAAFNDANRKLEEISKQKLTTLTAGLELPKGINPADNHQDDI